MAFSSPTISYALLAAAIASATMIKPAVARERVVTAARGEGASSYNERKGGALKVKFGILTLVAEYYEYNPDTCTEISPGMWTVKKKAKYGTVSTGTGSYTVPSGDDCAGDTFTTATVNYIWTESNPPKKHDGFIAYWTTPDGEFDYEEKAKIRLVK
jgi:hypothetical protein